MARSTPRRGPITFALMLAGSLLAGLLPQTTCQVTVPDMTLNVDDQAIHLEAPGLTVHIEPGRVQVTGSSLQVDTQ
jgi:hypothetical protein